MEQEHKPIAERQDVVNELYDRFFADEPRGSHGKQRRSAGFRGTDDELIEAAMAAGNGAKFSELWAGDSSSYNGDESAADQALCNLLAFWTGRDFARIDRLFRHSGLMRPKWDERHYADGRTYGEGTIHRAIEVTTTAYQEERASSTFRRTDLGNAERLVRRHGRDFHYCFPKGCFYIWRRRRWTEDESGKVMRHASATVRSIYREAARAATREEADELAKWAVASEFRARLEAMVALARSRRGIAVVAADLDSDPWLLNCRNGTIDLRAGKLRPHRREDLITRLAPVDYDAAAQCPLFDRFLNTIFCDDSALTEFVLRLLGMSLTGDVSEQILSIFHGEGNNGKNVLLDTVGGVMGDYATEAPPDLLASRQGERHPTELADLLGRRLVVASETEEGSILRLQLVKRLTGNARIKARFMRQDFFEFERTHKIILVTNNKPRVRENTEAAWRRLRLIPFNYVVPKEARDKRLLQKLRPEWPGILAKLVRACLRWQQGGLQEPAAVLTATEEYRAESNEVAEFVNECCITSPTAWAPSKTLREEYETWCKERGARPYFGRAFTERLRALGLRPEKRSESRGWLGVSLCAT